MTEKQIYRKVLKKWGYAPQLFVAVGESGELIAAINRFFNQGRGTKKDVAEEVADVEIICGQLRIILGDELVQEEKIRKLKLLEERLKEDV